MAIKIKSTKSSLNEGIKVLVYGKAGIGKTTLLATAPSPLIISCEGGLLSLSGYDIPCIEIKSLQDLRDVYDSLNKEKNEYKTICLDSISEIAEMALSEFKENVKDKRQAYMQLSEDVSKIIRSFRDIKSKNVVFVAKGIRVAIDDPEDNSSINTFSPSMPGKGLSNGLPFYFDEVFYMTEVAGKRVLKTATSPFYEAKDRSGKLASEEQSDLNYIFNKIRGKENV